jgi:integrase
MTLTIRTIRIRLIDMEALVTKYLESRQLAWSESTKRSEGYRLRAIQDELAGHDPLRLWNYLEKTQKPYTRSTTWTRVCDFYDWAISRGHLDELKVNPFKVFREENARLFKNVYTKNIPTLTYDEALHKISYIKDTAVRTQALRLLTGGLRYTESNTLKDGFVVGKGGKRRRVYAQGPEGHIENLSYQTFAIKLKAETGLKPHDLRKIFLNEVVNKGGNEFDLVELAGWSSISTASSYIKANSDRARSLVEKIHGGYTSETEQVPREVPKAS